MCYIHISFPVNWLKGYNLAKCWLDKKILQFAAFGKEASWSCHTSEQFPSIQRDKRPPAFLDNIRRRFFRLGPFRYGLGYKNGVDRIVTAPQVFVIFPISLDAFLNGTAVVDGTIIIGGGFTGTRIGLAQWAQIS